MSQTAYLQDILWQTKSQQWTHQQSNHHLCYFVRASLACLEFIATVCHRSLIEGDPPGVHTKGFRTKKQQQPLIVSSRLARQSRNCFAEPILHPNPNRRTSWRNVVVRRFFKCEADKIVDGRRIPSHLCWNHEKSAVGFEISRPRCTSWNACARRERNSKWTTH